MPPLTNMEDLEKVITKEVEYCNDLENIDERNIQFTKGKLVAYKQILEWVGRDVTLIAKVGGGNK